MGDERAPTKPPPGTFKPLPPPAPPAKRYATYTESSAVARMEAIGRSGITVSVCCGPSGGVFRWTVQALSADGQEFKRPFTATDFAHAVEIAELEILKRGWL